MSSDHEERYRNILDYIEDGYYETDLAGNFTFFNASVCRHHGRSREEMMGLNYRQYVDEEYSKILSQVFHNVYNTGNPARGFDWQIIRKDGSRRYIETSVSLIKDSSSGKPRGFRGISRDITERRNMESQRDAAIEALRKSEKHYREITENSSDIIVIVDENGNIKYCSRSVERFVGYKPEEMIGKSVFTFIHPGDMHRALHEFGKAIQAEDTAILFDGFLLLHKNGSEVYLEGTGKNLLHNPDIAGFVMNVRDVTKRRKAEEALKHSEAQYRLLADHMKDTVWLMDLNLNLIYISPSAEKLLGYTLEELSQILPDKPLTEASYQSAMEFYTIEMPRALAAPQDYVLSRPLELELYRKNGQTIWIETMLSFIRDEQGKPVSILGESRNITERKQIEDSLKKSEENFRRSLDDSPLGIRISTLEGEIIYANRAILNIYGYANMEELQKIPVGERYTPEACAEWRARREQRRRGEFGPSEYEVSIIRKNGEVRQLHVFRKETLWNGERHIQVIYQDISLRKQIEKNLRVTKEKYNDIFENIWDTWCYHDLEGNFIEANAAFQKLFDVQQSEDRVLNLRNIVPERYRAGVDVYLQDIRRNGKSTGLLRIVDKDGEERIFEYRNILVPDEKGVVGVRGSAREITERVKAEKALKKSEERYRSVFEHAGLPMVIMEDSLRIFMVNDRFVEKSGYGKDEIEGKMKFTDFVASGDRNALMECFSRRKGDKPVEYECQLAHRNGEWFDVLIRMGQIPGAGQFIASFTDITSRKQAELALLESQEQLQQENIRLRSSIRERYRFCDIIGKSQGMQEVYEFILQAAATQAHVIIYGESGTGKELVARAIHETSGRRQKRFVTVHCGAIPEMLMESEFFGYKKGAFTGASMDKPGYLDESDGGTLFLDEAGEIGLNMQVKLLRVIAGDGYTPVGSYTAKKTDTRVVAATNRNLRELVRQGVMREDFFYRIHILPIYLPPLRERRDDLPLLIDHFLQLYDQNHAPLPGHVTEALLSYDWPGNIRELQNVLQRYLTLKRLDFIGGPANRAALPAGESIKQVASVQPDYAASAFAASQTSPARDHDDIRKEESGMTLKELKAREKDYILKVLSEHNGHRGRTAAALGVNRKTLFRKMKKFCLI
jgi:PAS domain S-box-containing protein